MKKKIFILTLLSIFIVSGICYARNLQHNKNEYVTGVWEFAKPVTMNQTLDVKGSITGAINPGTGNIFYVDSGSGSNSGQYGKSVDKPYATLDYAVGQCTANNGDIIFIMPGHNENIGSGETVDLDVVGISVIGLGNGTNRPRFDFDYTSSDFAIGADNVYITNVTFLPGVASVPNGIMVESGVDHFVIENCEFMIGEAAGTDEFLTCINFVFGNDFSQVINNKFFGHTSDAATEAICLADTSAHIEIKKNWFNCDNSVAAIAGESDASTYIDIEDNVIYQLHATGAGVTLVNSTTGLIKENTFILGSGQASTSAAVCLSCYFEDNKYTEVTGSGASNAQTIFSDQNL